MAEISKGIYAGAHVSCTTNKDASVCTIHDKNYEVLHTLKGTSDVVIRNAVAYYNAEFGVINVDSLQKDGKLTIIEAKGHVLVRG